MDTKPPVDKSLKGRPSSRPSRVIPRITIWRDDGIIQHRDGNPCERWAAAMAASWRLSKTTKNRSASTSGQNSVAGQAETLPHGEIASLAA